MDEQRLKDLTAVAKTIWPKHGDVTVSQGDWVDGIPGYEVLGDEDVLGGSEQLLAVSAHPRALNMLEAALLVATLSQQQASRLLIAMTGYVEAMLNEDIA